jgi:hypothetical protein
MDMCAARIVGSSDVGRRADRASVKLTGSSGQLVLPLSTPVENEAIVPLENEATQTD